jgi:hypothetical protein
MTHQNTEGLWWIGVIALADYLIEHLTAHLLAESYPYRIVVADAEMIAGYYFAALHRLEVLNASDLFDNKLTLRDQHIKEA